MPLQLYDKEKIIHACFNVFAQHGYVNTSTAMLAEAAGISKALIFHHFKSKKYLYLSVLDRCIEKIKNEIGFDILLENYDFFEAKEKFSVIKFNYYKSNPNIMSIMTEAFYSTPDELKAEVQIKYGKLLAESDKEWRRAFEKVSLKKGVDRDKAFRLVMNTLYYLDMKYFSNLKNNDDLEETRLHEFIEERSSFLSMIRFGIEQLS
ncbi:MAG TPA: TetR/AcrR family transcriptional regulator [Acetivibrio sp.]|nr:TetR/AcrR family transcriptional regulator [Acetivibrio sp.]